MNPTRRQILKVTTLGGAAAGFAGFSTVSHFLSPFYSAIRGETPPFSSPQAEQVDEATHFLNRLTFGARPGEYDEIRALGPQVWLEQQLAPSGVDDSWTEARVRHFEALSVSPAGELLEYHARELLDQMTRVKILRAVHSRRQLKEVMVDFWSDHFNIDPSKGDSKWLQPDHERNVLRAHVLGNFRDLLKASALSPSMLWYLDGRVNRKVLPEDKPNENYGRELLELHTLGVDGGYTQDDVMEAARCLTGWTVRSRSENRFAVGKVSFDAALHDDGPKRVLGNNIPPGLGEGDLDRLLDILCRHPSTARYLAEKLCRRFISDDPPASAIAAVSRAFTTTGGDIPKTLRALFQTPEFLTARGQKVKRPFHFVVSALRACAARTDAGPALQNYLLRMGHAPWQYPTPDGYPEEAQPWMATLIWRWKFAVQLAAGGIQGTHFNAARLLKSAGGPPAMVSHFLGRRPSPAEASVLTASGNNLSLLISSPAFQTF